MLFRSGPEGVIELFNSSEAGSFYSVRIFSMSGGGLLLFGYGTALYRLYKAKNAFTPRAEGSVEEGE